MTEANLMEKVVIQLVMDLHLDGIALEAQQLQQVLVLLYAVME